MAKTRVLLVGSGAREHAIADALVSGGGEVYAFMQMLNPGLKRIAKRFRIGQADDAASAVSFARENSVEIAIIGPEAPLAAGMVDELEKNGIQTVGPTKKLAQLESSKSFTRNLIQKYGIKGNPEFKTFTKDEIGKVRDYMEKVGPCVVKPDGLTGGKGVKVWGEHLQTVDEAVDYCKEILGSHAAVIIEEKLEGEEFSLQTLTDGNGGFLHFPAVQDHKRALEGDAGQNTGGMGSYSDSNFLLPFLNSEDVGAARKITEAVAAAIRKEFGVGYRGVMYGGFMKTARGIKLLEYNARFGDPEAMNVMPLLKTSLIDVCKAVVGGRLAKFKVEFDNKATVCKYVVPKGYPDYPETGRIEVPSCENDYIKALVYYAAVEEKPDGVYTTKSRSVAFVGISDTMPSAEKIAEEAASLVKGDVYHRKDIGTWQLVNKRVEHINCLIGKKELNPLYLPSNGQMKVAAFLSGTGSNLRRILDLERRLKDKSPFKVVLIFSDTADENICNGRKIAAEYKIPYYCNDIRQYYEERGLNTRKDMKVREEFDSETARLMRMHKADIVALCGYMSIVTRPIIRNFLTVNVHPADLRKKNSDGTRKYAGLGGSDCVKKAIMDKESEIRSTTHIVTDEVDAGQILLVSKPVVLPQNAREVEAGQYQEKLKEVGDWEIYPLTLKMIAEGKFARSDKGVIYFDGKPIPEGKEVD